MAAERRDKESIRRVKKRIEEELLDLANVHAVDIGEKITGGEPTGELSIIVYVDEKKKQVAAKDKVPPEIEGIKTDVQEEEPDELHPALLRLEPDELLVDVTRYSTLMGGMSLGPCRAIYMEPPDVEAAGYYVTVGTLGAIVTDKTSGAPLMLTNFHVAAVDNAWSVGDDMAQPSRVDGGRCPSDRVGALQRGVLSSNVDGAVVSIEDRPYSCEIVSIGDVRGTRPAAVGMAVRKRGRTTELTHGVVISTDYTTTIPYGDGLGSVTLVDQVRIAVDAAQSTMFGTNGDSGSVVADAEGYVVGLYFAGGASGTRGVANPIAKVLAELNIEVCASTKPVDKGPKEHLKDFKEFRAETVEKRPFKEWLKWEKEKFEKEKPEKLEVEGWVGRPAPFEQKDPRSEKGPQSEYGTRPAGVARQISGLGSWPDPFAEPWKNFQDKPFPEVKDQKEGLKDKDEFKDSKFEFKEDLKDYKNEAKENKETKDTKDNKDFMIEGPWQVRPWEVVAQPARQGGIGGQQHFIPRHLRPDLSGGALRNEPR